MGDCDFIRNIPDRFDKDDRYIDGVVSRKNGVIQILNKKDADHPAYIIFELQLDAKPEDMARQIARAITQARNNGFEQGRKHIRDALGINI